MGDWRVALGFFGPPFVERKGEHCVAGRLEKAIIVSRDLILFAFGLVGIAYQTITGDVNFVLLAIFTAMTGVPGLTNLIVLSRGPRIESPSSSSVLPEQPTVSDNS